MTRASGELPRYKVADEHAGVFLGDTPTQPIRKHREAAGAAAASPRFGGTAGVLTWLDSRWWQWGADVAAWRPIARSPSSMRWSEPLPLGSADGSLEPFLRAQLGASGAEPIAMRLGDGRLYLITAERGGPVLRAASSEPATLSALAPPAVAEELAPFVDVADSMRRAAEQIARDFRRRRVVEDAGRVFAWASEAGLVGPRGRPDRRGIMRALFEDTKRRSPFHDDPHNTELIGSTEAILCLDPDGACLRGGDCDDQIVQMTSRAMALGVPCRLRARRYKNQRQLHVVIEYNVARKGNEVWEAIDPSTETGHASDAPYLEELVQLIDTAPAFVGLGDPGGGGEDMLGDATTAQQVDPAIQSALVGLLGSVKSAFDDSLSKLQAVSTQYAQIRTTLGLPATDATPAGSSGTLADYVTSVDAGSPVWTATAAAAEAKLIASGLFFSQCLAEGLSGKRTLTYDPSGGPDGKGDLFVASADGDAYRVGLVKSSSGAWVPQYLDPATNQPTTLGFPWTFVVGAAAVAVVSLAAAWAVSHYMDKLRQEHLDDTLLKVTQDAIASGATPDQVSARVAAVGQAGAAMGSAAPPSPVTSNLATIAQWLAIAGVAVAGVFVTRSIVSAFPERRRA